MERPSGYPGPYQILHEAIEIPDFCRFYTVLEHTRVVQKLYTLKNTPPSQWIGFFDFDKCFTMEDGSIYQRIYKRLPLEGQHASDAVREACLKLEKSPQGLPDEIREAWTDYEVGLYAKYRLTKEDIRHAMSGDRLRPGAREAVSRALAVGARVNFISQGLADAIECVDLPWEHSSLSVVSNRLVYDDEGHILHRLGQSKVSASNKHVYAERLFRATGLAPEESMAIVMGDSFHDANMVPEGALPPERVLRICVPPPGAGMDFLHRALHRGATPNPPYDMVMTGTEELYSVADMFDWAAGCS